MHRYHRCEGETLSVALILIASTGTWYGTGTYCTKKRDSQRLVVKCRKYDMFILRWTFQKAILTHRPVELESRSDLHYCTHKPVARTYQLLGAGSKSVEK
jgi:hypothetical protein